MQYPDHLPDNHSDKEFEGKPKGIARILKEHGLIKRVSPHVNRNLQGDKVIAVCKECEAEKSRKVSELPTVGPGDDNDDDSGVESEAELERVDCCLTCMLGQQADFRAQKSMLDQVISDAGHRCLFLPKFHCELNPIEYYWGWVKQEFHD